MMKTLLPENGFVKLVGIACLSASVLLYPNEPCLPTSIFNKVRLEDAPSQITVVTYINNCYNIMLIIPECHKP